VRVANNFINVNLVTKEAADATEAFAELVALRRLVRDELNENTVPFVVHQKPIRQLLACNDF
jgi:hypothetical protein